MTTGITVQDILCHHHDQWCSVVVLLIPLLYLCRNFENSETNVKEIVPNDL